MSPRFATLFAVAFVVSVPACSEEVVVRSMPPRVTASAAGSSAAPVAGSAAPMSFGSAPVVTPQPVTPMQPVPITPLPAAATSGEKCGADGYRATPKHELELVVLFDNSASMAIPRLDDLGQFLLDTASGQAALPWNVAVSEMTTFVRDAGSTGLSISLKYFGAECTADFYAIPDVPMGKLPAQADAVANSLLATLPLSDTATLPALQGGLRYARQRMQANASARVVIVLVTDGAPDPGDCTGNDTASVARVAAEGFAGMPAIPTYVLATAPGLDLDMIAQAGGTSAALLADLAAPGQLVKIMNDVRGRELAALPCDYALPREYSTYDDPNLVNLAHNGRVVGRVANAGACDALRGGWFYDALPKPMQIRVCDATCDQLQAGGSVQVELGCPVVELGPQ